MGCLGSGYLLTPLGNWLSRQDVGCCLLLSHRASGKQEERREIQPSLNPGCPGKTAMMLIFLEYLETAASFLKALEDSQWCISLTKIMAPNKDVCQRGFVLSKKRFPRKLPLSSSERPCLPVAVLRRMVPLGCQGSQPSDSNTRSWCSWITIHPVLGVIERSVVKGPQLSILCGQINDASRVSFPHQEGCTQFFRQETFFFFQITLFFKPRKLLKRRMTRKGTTPAG